MSLSEVFNVDQIHREVERKWSAIDPKLQEMLHRRCLVYSLHDEDFWVEPSEGTTTDVNDAYVYTVAQYFGMQDPGRRTHHELWILKDASQEPVPAGRKCLIAGVLRHALIESLRLAPGHDGLRAQVLAVLKQPLPDEAKTFEQIKDWIEINIDPALISKTPPPKPPRQPTRIDVSVEESANGNCHWRGRRIGNSSYEIPDQEILDIAHDSVNDGLSWDGFMGRVREWLTDLVYDNMPDMNIDYDSDTLELSHIDVDNNGDSDLDFNRDVLRTIVIEILNRHEPETIEQLRRVD